MSAPEQMVREAHLDGVRLTLPAPRTPWRALGRLALVIFTGVGGFIVGGIVGGMLAAMTELWPLMLLAFGGVWIGLLLADRISAALLPILAPVVITLGSSHMEVAHRQQRQRLALSEIAAFDYRRQRLITRDGRRIQVAPQQPAAVQKRVLREVAVWVAARLDEQGSAGEVPAALQKLSTERVR